MTSGCASNDGLNNEDNGTTENTLPEENQIESDDTGLINEDDGMTEDILPEAVQMESAASEDAAVEETNDQSSDSKIQDSFPQVSIRGSILDDGKYLLEHQSGNDMDLANVRLILSSDGQTQVYSPITETSEIMTVGDKMEIDINSGIFSINGNPIDVTDPEAEETSLSTTNMILIHVPSEKIIAYITLS
ncbi:hypothetical protein [uncultured Methanolobus sp.]|uniref:hypothetical protein n=1 Tax=uncultured Methanolobus sp. TaxID=218300 RepID=UPI0029C6E487|nr:hypothetical protein [uncultured Methanolobus sp.]